MGVGTENVGSDVLYKEFDRSADIAVPRGFDSHVPVKMDKISRTGQKGI
jgi:hypothetical protein